MSIMKTKTVLRTIPKTSMKSAALTDSLNAKSMAINVRLLKNAALMIINGAIKNTNVLLMTDSAKTASMVTSNAQPTEYAHSVTPLKTAVMKKLTNGKTQNAFPRIAKNQVSSIAQKTTHINAINAAIQTLKFALADALVLKNTAAKTQLMSSVKIPKDVNHNAVIKIHSRPPTLNQIALICVLSVDNQDAMMDLAKTAATQLNTSAQKLITNVSLMKNAVKLRRKSGALLAMENSLANQLLMNAVPQTTET